MAIIQSKSNDDWRSKRSQEQLMLGGLPLNAEWRLRTLNENQRLFTSNLSVNEFVLTRAERITPLGQVTGNCSYHVGWQPTAVYTSMELTVVSRAHNQTWRLALSRLQAEARVLGAHGVVGVTLKSAPSSWSDRMLEVSAQGTAIRWQGASVTSAPFVSALSGQEFWALLNAGYHPVGVAYGTCVYQQVTTNTTRWATGSGILNSTARVNQEMHEYTSAFHESRCRAVQYMEDEARQLGAEGVVGVKIEKQISICEVEVEINEYEKQKRKDLIARFFILGTAIAPFIEYQPVIHAVTPLS
ncbi:MAG: heavy metal-binding domain-containing protein [Janthinobacterium lividum]